MIFNKFWELKSLNKLETYFLQSEIYTRNKLDFSVSTLRRILTNPVYAANDTDILEYFKQKGVKIYADGDRANFDGKYGLMGYGKNYGKKEKEVKDWIVSVGLHPAIIKGIDWVRTQELLEKNKEKRYRADCKHDFLFSGILKCSECGSYMRPKVSEGERFYYTCELKEKSRGTRCHGKNIAGLALDQSVIQKLQQIFVPNSEIYKELEKMSIRKDTIDSKDREEELKRKLKKNQEAIKNLVDKLKYMDIEVVDIINSELKKLKQENEEIQEELLKLEKNQNAGEYGENSEAENAMLVLDIINNYFKTFECFDLKSKRDILKLLIEDMRGNGKNIEIDLLNTKISETDKRLLSNPLIEATNKKDLNVVSRTGKQFH